MALAPPPWSEIRRDQMGETSTIDSRSTGVGEKPSGFRRRLLRFMNSSSQVAFRDPATLLAQQSVVSFGASYYTAQTSLSLAEVGVTESSIVDETRRDDGVAVGASNSPLEGPSLSLVEMVRGDMLLALAICETCPVAEIEIMLPVMMDIFNTRASLLVLLEAIIDKQVSRLDPSTELFPTNTLGTRLLANVAKIQGYNYLRLILTRLLEEMVIYPLNYGLILDPTKGSQAEIDANLANIQKLTRTFLEVVAESAEILPPLCRVICAHIEKKVSLKRNESKYSAIAEFLFLQFICPAIASPWTVNLPVPPNFREGLLLVANIVQHLANNLLFHEPHMIVLNGLLEDTIILFVHFLVDVIKLPEYHVEESVEWHDSSYDKADSLVLDRFCYQRANAIGKELLILPRVADENGGGHAGKQTWDNLCSILVTMPIGNPDVTERGQI